MDGYYKNKEATDEAIHNGLLHTGDLGYVDGDGFLFVTGRAKALLISAEGLINAAQVIDRLRSSFYSFERNGARFPKQWVPASFMILKKPFSEANRMINSTMKMVRYRITDAYADELEYLYTDEGQDVGNPRNLETVRELFELSS